MKAFILLGTNLGNKPENLRRAAVELEKRAGRVLKTSSIYETAPWGMPGAESFLNQVLLLETLLGPKELMSLLLDIERGMGRLRRAGITEERIIDLDILFYDTLIMEEEGLVLPHPRLHLRKFTLVPLNEIAPAFLHPALGKTVAALLAECTDALGVKLMKNNSLGWV